MILCANHFHNQSTIDSDSRKINFYRLKQSLVEYKGLYLLADVAGNAGLTNKYDLIHHGF